MYAINWGSKVKPGPTHVIAAEATDGPCPDETFLRKLAGKSKKISIVDPRIDHAANCPRCKNQLLLLRREHRFQQLRVAVVTVLAVCAVLAVGRYTIESNAFRNDAVPITRTVDLRGGVAVGGQPRWHLPSLEVPAAIFRISIFLPSNSPTGLYVVAVRRNQDGSGDAVDIQQTLSETGDGDQQNITDDLDLRQAEAGQYFLLIHDVSHLVSFSIPLRVR